ncbi:hypothetical protein SEUCBS140593_001718 [Sporothrix eucalyptigena]|uniref:Major facilitator superfamily (MFS) profile domain-containing protein n=1 Tax=Sporothrix eucalyptigena TaxID=1812306 RepID=A0ABP0B0H4_9PEZI
MSTSRFLRISQSHSRSAWVVSPMATTFPSSPPPSARPADHRHRLWFAGAIFGALFVGWLCDRYGRRPALMVAALINVVGGALQAGSVHIGMFIAARFITGFSSSMFVTLVPIYIAEVAPPASRGLLVGQHGAFFLIGYTLAAWVGVGSFFAKSEAFNWRFPLSLQVLWPLLQLCFVKWLPESPRWLVSNGRKEEAWAILARLHYDPKDPEQSFAHREFAQITQQIALDKSTYGDVGYVDLFTRPHFRKRTLIGALVMWASQANGAIVIYSNIVSLVAGLGFSSTDSLLLSAGWITLACVGNFTNAYFLDKLGRVRSMTALAAGVAMLFGFIVFYGGFVDTTIYVYGSEIFPTHIRAKGMGWCLSIFFLSTLPFLESSATGFATIGWKYYLLFIILPSINVVLIKLFCPETKGLSLEEINGVFNDQVAMQLTHIDGESATVEPASGVLDTSNSSNNGSGEKSESKIHVV